MNEPKITVIIPTRERCDVLEKSLHTVTAQDYDNLEIVVSDNYSGDGTEDVVRSTHDSRVKYLNTGRRLSMSHNWEFALSHITDGWVTIVGDDDGLLPASLRKIADIINSTEARAIRSQCCFYRWPSLTGTDHGSLSVPLRSGHEVRDSKLWLSKLMGYRTHFHDLPTLYTGGFVCMSVVRHIKEQSGSFYQSCTPDIYSAVAISSVIDNYFFSHEPLAIFGLSKHSTGISHFSGTKTELSAAHKFRSEGNIPFHKDIPLCADGSYPLSLQAIVYEAYLQSAFLREDAKENIHKQQLEVILARPGKHAKAVSEWGKAFATTHRLDYDDIQSNARLEKILLRAALIPPWISSVMNTYDVASSEVPIRDVYEASIAAAAIRNVMPSRLRNIHRLVGRAAKELKRRLT